MLGLAKALKREPNPRGQVEVQPGRSVVQVLTEQLADSLQAVLQRAPVYEARRSNFQAVVAATHRTGYLKPPTVLWDMLDEALITIHCETHDPAGAAQIVRSMIRRPAEYVAQIGVSEIDVIKVSQCD